MISFVLREDGTCGYPPANSEILAFMRKELSLEHRSLITDSPSRSKSECRNDIATAIWNHSIAVGLLQACFEECKLVRFIMSEVTR